MRESERTSGTALLVDWANDQDHWVRALVGAVLDTRRVLSPEVIDELYELLLLEKGLTEEQEPVTVPPLEHDGETSATEQALRLTKLSSLANVNALAPDQDIVFSPRMTVLYGENGAGKTGYVRVLKQLASVRTAEPVLPNISSVGETGVPRGLIAYELDDSPNAFSWSGEGGVSPFTRIDVFDARGVDVHVDGELTYVYTPGELAVFRHTHSAIEAVKDRLEKACNQAQPSGNPYLNKFSREGKLYVKIETLGATTDLAELEALGVITDTDKAQLDPLMERVDALRSGTSDAKLQLAESEKDILERVLETLESGRTFDTSSHAKALEAVTDAERAHTHATKEALSGEGIPGVLEDSWRRFIETGEEYLKEHYDSDYPHEGDSCPYCLQDLNAAAIDVVRKYRAFCRSELQNAVEQAHGTLEALVQDLLGLEIEELEQEVGKRIDAARDGESPHASLLASRDYLTELRNLQLTVAKAERADVSQLKQLLLKAESELNKRTTELERLVADLRTEVGKRKELLESESAKLRALQDRITLNELLSSIRKHVESAKWSSRAATLVTRFRQVGKSLTETTKLASEQLLNDDFERIFVGECQALRAPRVTLDFPGRRGQPARRKRLTPDHRLSETLSEGEQKVVALADFIAEATLRRSSTPLVLDDPVTSLDYRRLRYVVDRLVELSKTRQVIVFTHNIWFTMELLGKFDDDRKACTYYDVAEEGDSRGIISPGESPKLDTWGDKKKRINKLVERIKTEDDKEMRDQRQLKLPRDDN